MNLIFNIFTYYVGSDLISYTPDEISIIPKFTRPQLLPQFRKLLKYLTGRHTLQYLYHLRRRIPRRYLNKYVHMVRHNLHCVYTKLILLGYMLKHLFQILRNFPTQYLLPILRYPYQMILQIIYGMFGPSNPHIGFIQEKALFTQAPLPRLTASHFPPTSKLAGIQWSFL